MTTYNDDTHIECVPFRIYRKFSFKQQKDDTQIGLGIIVQKASITKPTTKCPLL